MTLGLILNTRASIYQERFHLTFGDLPWAIFDCPVTLPEPLAAHIPPSTNYDALIFTSQIAVGTFAPTPDWLNKKVYAVGQGTAEMAAAVGFTDVTQTGLTVEDMRMYLSTIEFKSALYPSAVHITYDLEQAFPGRVRRMVIYRMVPRSDLPQQPMFWRTCSRRQASPPTTQKSRPWVSARMFSPATAVRGMTALPRRNLRLRRCFRKPTSLSRD
jgi:uroporphyrinogen-III synthase